MRSNYTATAVIFALLAGVSTSAMAADGFYGAAGGSLIQATSEDYSEPGVSGELEYDLGYGVFGAVGYRFGQFRAEGEINYGNIGGAEASGTMNGQSGSLDVNASLDLWTFTVSGYYDFTTGSAFTPYIGAGVGLAITDLEDVEVEGFELGSVGSDESLTLHGEVGFSYRLTDSVELVPSYRFIWLDNGQDGVDDSTAHQFRVAARFAF